MQNNNLRFVIYDFETTGRNSNWDQIIQVGAILVNNSFEELDRIEIRSSLKPGLIPEPGALIVNNTSTEILKKSNLTHYHMVNEILRKFNEWSPAIFIGYNSIDFDEEFLRKTFFKSLHNPYLTQLNGNKRADILSMVRSASLFFPESIKFSNNEKGNPILKLDQIAPLNNINHLAHDALGDVLATNEIGKILYKNANVIWEAGLENSSRSDVQRKINSELLFCYNEFFFGKTKPFLLSFICNHPVYKWAQCFDLLKDPTEYLNMSKSELALEMKKKPKFIRSIKDNKNPIIIDYKNFLKLNNNIKMKNDEFLERAKLLHSSHDFSKKISDILLEFHQNENEFESQEEVQAEESLYKGGFFSNTDKNIMSQFHNAEWGDKLSICDKFNDERLFYFGMRLIYEESPSTLPKDIYKNIHASIANQILSMDNEKWNTIPKAYKESDDLKVKYENDYEKLEQLENFDKLIDEIHNQFQ